MNMGTLTLDATLLEAGANLGITVTSDQGLVEAGWNNSVTSYPTTLYIETAE